MALPKEIQDIEKQIETITMEAANKAVNDPTYNYRGDVKSVVKLMLKKDRLYGKWIKGRA